MTIVSIQLAMQQPTREAQVLDLGSQIELARDIAYRLNRYPEAAEADQASFCCGESYITSD